MKRQWRNDMSQEQRNKISAANSGRKQSEDTKRKISKRLTDYWAKLPTKPTDTGTTDTTVTQNPYGDN